MPPLPLEGIPHEKIPLEVAAFSTSSALIAQNCGAQRIELNANGSYAEGGTTPDLDDFMTVAPQLKIPVHIMIRPHGPPTNPSEDFVYEMADIHAMVSAISNFKATGMMNPIRGDAFIFGLLAADPEDAEKLTVEKHFCKELIGVASPIPCYFHRAFDVIAEHFDWEQGIADLKDCGFAGVLTSGGRGKCNENVDRLADIVIAAGKDLQVIIGGGLRPDNVKEVVGHMMSRRVQPDFWVHSACLAGWRGAHNEEVDPDTIMGIVGDLGWDITA